MKRYLTSYILKDLSTKIVLLSGPRQCGKTTCAKALHQSYDYLNYDSSNDRLLIKKQHWDRDKKLIIFDELHKMPQWKRWIKGVYDTEGIPPQLLITGSAQLDTHRRVGDSLAGRYFQFPTLLRHSFSATARFCLFVWLEHFSDISRHSHLGCLPPLARGRESDGLSSGSNRRLVDDQFYSPKINSKF